MNLNLIDEHEHITEQLNNIIQIFKISMCNIRPHFILTGPSGSGKSHVIKLLAENHKIAFMEINAAQLTKEGTAGNSLSKSLSPLITTQNMPTIVFVDEFDKLFISGNTNTDTAHETTNGVQNEFLQALECDETCVFGDYGKYIKVSVKNVLFVFAGAFNGENPISIDRLRDFGVKTEFIGRVGLIYNIPNIGLESLFMILRSSSLLHQYLEIFPSTKKRRVLQSIEKSLRNNYENNTLGVRLVHTLINQYFIKNGDVSASDSEKASFQTTMTFKE